MLFFLESCFLLDGAAAALVVLAVILGRKSGLVSGSSPDDLFSSVCKLVPATKDTMAGPFLLKNVRFVGLLVMAVVVPVFVAVVSFGVLESVPVP